MKDINIEVIKPKIKLALTDLGTHIDSRVEDAINNAIFEETQSIAKDVLQTMLDNYRIARSENIPVCQDTGSVVFLLELGEELCFKNSLINLLHECVSEVWKEHQYRDSIVKDPVFHRNITKNNSPAIIHTELVKGDDTTIYIALKGGGAENMSALKMLNPSDGREGIKKFIIDTVLLASGNACPPIIIGVGVGGNFEQVAYLSKKALFRELQSTNSDKEWAAFEQEILTDVNELGIGPQGLGGKTTALAVHIETAPCHIASLPVAVNLQCHAHRITKIVLQDSDYDYFVM